MDQVICGFHSRLSHEAFPRGFPTGMSDVSPWCESILGLKVEAVQGKQVFLEWTETSGDSGNVARTWSSSRLSCGECLLLRCHGNAGNFFPTTQGKDPSGARGETWLLWMWAGLSCFLSSGDGYVGELLELQQGCEGPFESSRG